MSKEFIEYLKENMLEAEIVFNEAYDNTADEEGEWMREDERFYDGMESEEFYMENAEIYEDFAHATGHSASYAGAAAVIQELGFEFDVDSEDSSLQGEVAELFGVDY